MSEDQDVKRLTPGGDREKSKITEVASGKAVERSATGDHFITAPIPGQTVVTPGGYRSPVMVHTIEPGHVLDGSHGRIRKLVQATGVESADFGILASRDPHQPLMPGNAYVPPERVAAFGSGWIMYAYWANNTGRHLNVFRTTWIVPSPPSTQSAQTIFQFNGIQNSTMIYQPVLQWGPSADGGGSYWAVASWYVDGQGGQAFTTPLVRVNPGDALVGVITLNGQSASGFSYNCEFEGIANTRLPIQNVEELTWCIQTLEAYGVAACSDYPQTQKTAFTGIEIQTGGQEAAIRWTPVNLITDCGQRAEVVSNASPGGEVDLYYHWNLTVEGDVSTTFASQRSHCEVLFERQDGHLHYFYVQNNAWLNDGQSFNAAGAVSALNAVFEVQRTHTSVFVKGQDGYLHFFYVQFGGWQHDGVSFHAAGQIPGAISAVFEPQRNHCSVFVKGQDGYLHFFYVQSGGWQHDGVSFLAGGQITGAISVVFEPQRNHCSAFVKGQDGYLQFFYVQNGGWQRDGVSFHAADQIPGAISAVFEPQRNHCSAFVKGQDGYLHFFYVQNGGWQHDGVSFLSAGQITGAISAVFEPQRNHCSVFVKGQDGYLHFFYVQTGGWQHDGVSFQ